MDREYLKNKAKDSLRNCWGTAILAYVISIVAASLLSSTGVGSLFSGMISVALAAGFLQIVRYESASATDFIVGATENFGTKFISTLLVSIYTFLWSLLFIIPGIVKSYAYALVPYILNDRPELSATDAIYESERMMDGYKMELFLLDLSFIGWMILAGCSCGLLSFWLAPYMSATRAAFYLELVERDATPSAEEE